MADITSKTFRPSKAGSPRMDGMLADGSGSLSRKGSIVQAGTIASSPSGGKEANSETQYKAAKSDGTENFKPSKDGVR